MRNILDKAEASGDLKPGGTVVAASSGNTGASTAMMCAMRGYQCVITTSAKCSKEKMDAQVVVVVVAGSINRSKLLHWSSSRYLWW